MATEWQHVPRVRTIAGKPSMGNANGRGKSARFCFPTSIAVQEDGNIVVCDQGNHTIRRINEDRKVSLIAGSGKSGFANGKGSHASFNQPTHIIVDDEGCILVADFGNRTIRKISRDGVVSTICGKPGASGCRDGPALEAEFKGPCGLALGPSGTLYIADKLSSRVCRLQDGIVTTISRENWFFYPLALLVLPDESVVVCDGGRYSVFRISSDTQHCELIAGCGERGNADGNGHQVSFDYPVSIARDRSTGLMYVSDFNNHAIRCVSIDGTVTSFAGRFVAGYADWVGTAAAFRNPYGVAISSTVNGEQLVVSDFSNHCIRAVDIPDASLKFLSRSSEEEEVGKLRSSPSLWGFVRKSNRVRRTFDARESARKFADLFDQSKLAKARETRNQAKKQQRHDFHKVVEALKTWSSDKNSQQCYPDETQLQRDGRVRLECIGDDDEEPTEYQLPRDVFLRTTKVWLGENNVLKDADPIDYH